MKYKELVTERDRLFERLTEINKSIDELEAKLRPLNDEKYGKGLKESGIQGRIDELNVLLDRDQSWMTDEDREEAVRTVLDRCGCLDPLMLDEDGKVDASASTLDEIASVLLGSDPHQRMFLGIRGDIKITDSESYLIRNYFSRENLNAAMLRVGKEA